MSAIQKYGWKEVLFLLFPATESIGAYKTQIHNASAHTNKHTQQIVILASLRQSNKTIREKKSAELYRTIINLGQYISNPICYTRVHCFAYIITTTTTIIFNWCFSDYLNEKGKSCGIIIEFILVVLAVLIYSSHRQHYHQSLFDKVNVYYKTIWTQNYGGKKIERAKKSSLRIKSFFVGWSLFIFFFYLFNLCTVSIIIKNDICPTTNRQNRQNRNKWDMGSSAVFSFMQRKQQSMVITVCLCVTPCKRRF